MLVYLDLRMLCVAPAYTRQGTIKSFDDDTVKNCLTYQTHKGQRVWEIAKSPYSFRVSCTSTHGYGDLEFETGPIVRPEPDPKSIVCFQLCGSRPNHSFNPRFDCNAPTIMQFK